MATVWQQRDLNERIFRDPDGFITAENARYERQIAAVAGGVCERFHSRCLVLLSGPSSAGKTTTADHLRQRLRAHGREAYTVSLDDFYLGLGKAPVLPDGSYDYETIDALDLPVLQQCMDDLLERGSALLPMFDFLTGRPKEEKRLLTVGEDSIVIFEGIHALHPRLEEHLTGDTRFKILINVSSAVNDGEQTLLSPREIRLLRRLIRDLRFRGSSLENTMDMWQQVVRGEDLYLFPYVDTADAVFDTTHGYELSLMRRELWPLLREYSVADPFAPTVRRLAEALSGFEPLSPERLPSRCLLREFVG